VGQGLVPVQENLTRIHYLPKRKALNFCFGSDFLFVGLLPSSKWIPMKIYDYLRLGRPILACVPEDGGAAKIIKEAKAGFVLSYDREKMERQLENIFAEWRGGHFKDFHPDWEYVGQFERKKLTKKLSDIFDEVVGQRSSSGSGKKIKNYQR
jgi:hypothetical protein